MLWFPVQWASKCTCLPCICVFAWLLYLLIKHGPWLHWAAVLWVDLGALINKPWPQCQRKDWWGGLLLQSTGFKLQPEAFKESLRCEPSYNCQGNNGLWFFLITGRQQQTSLLSRDKMYFIIFRESKGTFMYVKAYIKVQKGKPPLKRSAHNLKI